MFLQDLSNCNIHILDNKNSKSQEFVQKTEFALKEIDTLFKNLLMSYLTLNNHLKRIDQEINQILSLLKQDEQSLLKDSFLNQNSLIYELGKEIYKTQIFLNEYEKNPLMVNLYFDKENNEFDKKFTFTILDNLICHSFLYHKRKNDKNLFKNCFFDKIKNLLMDKLNLTFINHYHYFSYSKINFNDNIESKNGLYYFKPVVFNNLLHNLDLDIDLTKNKEENFSFFFKNNNEYSKHLIKDFDDFFHYLFFTHQIGENKLNIYYETVDLINKIKLSLNHFSEEHLNVVTHEAEIREIQYLNLYLDHFLEIRKINFKINNEDFNISKNYHFKDFFIN